MNVDLTMISVPIGGAVIGYITNWLAIKMLFKPYTEKRIFGIKIPFTPGLIPKERERIATAIGEVVGNYLLTNDVIVNELTSENMDHAVVEYVDNLIFDNENEINIEGLLNKIPNQGVLTQHIKMFVSNQVISLINDEAFIDEISKRLAEELKGILESVKISDHKEFINNFIRNIIDSPDTKAFIASELSKGFDQDVKISDFLGEDIVSNIKGAISYNELNIKGGVKELLKRDDLASGVKGMISSVMESKLGALGAMFVNPDSIYESIVDAVNDKVDEIELSKHINDYLTGVFEKQLFELVPSNISDGIVNEIVEKITGEIIRRDLSETIGDSNVGLYELIDKATEYKTADIMKDFIKKHLMEIDEEALKGFMDDMLERLFSQLSSNPIKLSSDSRKRFDDKIVEMYRHLVNKNVPRLIKNTKVIELVESQINSFEIDMLEEIILSIAKKELRAITWFGALLGFVMSLVILAVG